MPDLSPVLLASLDGTIAASWDVAAPLTLLGALPPPPPTVPAEIKNFLPALVNGQRIIGRRTALEFDVTGAFERVEIAATFADLTLRDVVHDADGFAPLYSLSTKTEITGGLHFKIERAGGWPSGRSPALRVRAYAADGTVSVLL